MGQIDYKLIKEAFFNSYKSFMNFLRLTNETNIMYNILILRKHLNDNLTNVNIIINSIDTTDENHNYNFKTNAVLTNEEAQELIEDIRLDFKNSHYISYSSANQSNLIQRLQNTNFSLNIKLLNEEELKDAIHFNDEINKDVNRHKVLTKN